MYLTLVAGRLKPLTLRSIPKMRSFVNDTLLDVLFYTSPVYCQVGYMSKKFLLGFILYFVSAFITVLL